MEALVVAKEKAVVDFDHHSAEFAEHPDETFAELRARCPVAHTDRHGGFWVVTRYDDVATAARDDATFSSDHDVDGTRHGYGGINIPPTIDRPIPIEMDPPEFFPFRRLLNPHFSPAATEKMRPRIREMTDACIDAAIESGRIDLVLDLANPVPSLMTLEILGLPLTHAQRFADVAHAMIYTPPGSPNRRQVLEDHNWMMGLVRETIEERKTHPAGDLISSLLASKVEGRSLTDDEVEAISRLIIAGGVDTTTALIANALLYLDRNRAARRQLLDQPELIPSACEEFLRVYTPVQALARTATRDVELGNQSLEAGDRLLLCWASANHDEAAFDRPEDVVLDRHPNRHTAFGLGSHRCLGSNLARAEFCIVLEQVLQRMPDYRVHEDESERYESIGIVNGWVRMPASFTPGPRLGALA